MGLNIKQFIREELKRAINEKAGAQQTDIKLGGEPFKLILDVNKNPTKKGIKVQFVPLTQTQTGQMDTKDGLSNTQQKDLQIKILNTLNTGLRPIGLEADIDPDVPYSNVIGYYIHLQYFDKIIRDALKGADNDTKENNP